MPNYEVQCQNAVALATKQDQIVWAIFGLFWTANAVLLIALFPNGTFPQADVGLIISLFGFGFSSVWTVIQYRAQAWLLFFEDIIKKLEGKMEIPTDLTLLNQHDKVRGLRVRTLMFCCPILSILLWLWATCYFCHVLRSI